MFRGLGEERTKIRKKKKENKEKTGKRKKRKNPHRGQRGLVEMKQYRRTYNSVKYFLPYLNRF